MIKCWTLSRAKTYRYRMIYFLVIETALFLALLSAKLIVFPRLGATEKVSVLERWSLNFSYEIINRLISITIGMLILSHLDFTDHIAQDWIYFIFYILVLDFIFYWRHRLYHRWFWVFHRAHHSDSGYDFTLSSRIHPIETVIQIGIFIAVSYFFRMSQWQTFFAAHIFSLQALISHLDYEIPNSPLFRWVRKIFVVSDSHRFHHDHENPDTNFGFLFSFWDRIFKTNTTTIIPLTKNVIF